MPILRPDDLTELTPELIGDLNRETLEKLMLQVVDLARDLANRVNMNSSNSSRPPSSDDPYRRQANCEKAAADKRDKDDGAAGDGDGSSGAVAPPPADKPSAKRPGKRPGMPGHGRSRPMVVTGEIDHGPICCERCAQPLSAEDRHRVDGAHYVYDLERGDMALRLTCVKHRYFAAVCTCGHETVDHPGKGQCSKSAGRKRDLVLSERCLVGPMLATFIAALAKRGRLSRAKVQEFLHDWFGLDLGVATINRCIHEFGMASEPVVEDLIKELQQAEVLHLDETPWYQSGVLLWMWVAVSRTIVVFHIGSRAKAELAALVGESFLGWLVTDGYVAYMGRRLPRTQHMPRHGGLRHVEAELQQLTVNSRRTPQRVFPAHLADKIADFFGCWWTSGPPTSRFPSPEQAKSKTMPRDDGLGFDDDECVAPTRPQARKHHPKQAVPESQSRPRHRSLEHRQLLTKCEDFHLECRSAHKGVAERGADKEKICHHVLDGSVMKAQFPAGSSHHLTYASPGSFCFMDKSSNPWSVWRKQQKARADARH